MFAPLVKATKPKIALNPVSTRQPKIGQFVPRRPGVGPSFSGPGIRAVALAVSGQSRRRRRSGWIPLGVRESR